MMRIAPLVRRRSWVSAHITLRENTERPVTVTEGTMQVVGTDPARMAVAVGRALAASGAVTRAPELWDGRVAGCIMAVLIVRVAQEASVHEPEPAHT